MHLVQLLLPLYDNDGRRQPDALFQRVRAELTDRFGGLTAYTRAPARGTWQDNDGHTDHDEIIVYEVMVDALDRSWWAAYREGLEAAFKQRALVIRAEEITLL
jgi:hypothetical protein